MGHELPDYAFQGVGGLGDVGNDLLFDRPSLGSLVFAQPRSLGWGEEDMDGLTDLLKSAGKKIVGTATGIVKATGKGIINAAASRVGLGPIFSDKPAAGPGGAPAPVNYTPFIIGGAAVVALGLVVVLTRRK